MTDTLKTVAEAVENVMLEGVATRSILDYCIDLVRDDNSITVCWVKNVPIKVIECSFVLRRAKDIGKK